MCLTELWVMGRCEHAESLGSAGGGGVVVRGVWEVIFGRLLCLTELRVMGRCESAESLGSTCGEGVIVRGVWEVIFGRLVGLLWADEKKARFSLRWALWRLLGLTELRVMGRCESAESLGSACGEGVIVREVWEVIFGRLVGFLWADERKPRWALLSLTATPMSSRWDVRRRRPRSAQYLRRTSMLPLVRLLSSGNIL